MATTKRKYSVKSCHKTKTAAKKEQKAMHAKGQTAKIVAKEGKYCVASAGAKKKAKKK
jgi:hypothetical protein